MSEGSGDDWTCGVEALTFQHCSDCGTIRYVRRAFCPACGSRRIEVRRSSGCGRVYAITTVSRAPSAAWRALAPYAIALVDAQEGFRFMAHAAPGLAIGDAVVTRYRRIGEGLVPFVQAEQVA